jgi:hypothetical protein
LASFLSTPLYFLPQIVLRFGPSGVSIV